MSDVDYSSFLAVSDLRVAYGAIQVVHGVSLAIETNYVSALLGANGAGKSSTLKAIAGLVPAVGSIHFDGKDISKLNAAQRFHLGISYVPEGRAIVSELSVEENLLLGGYFVDRKIRKRRQESILNFFPELANRLKAPAGFLSGGEQQMLTISRSLMSAPRLLLLDEPSLGLAPLLISRVYERLSEIHEKNPFSALLVEQNFYAATKFARQAWIMRNGILVGELDEEAIKDNDARNALIGAYLGK
ncbi:ABC transporter ATP-binding protein [Castellaniella sp.]|uniref:ABC transporter ATP-binding protein n=1 Tax=Castellaniella sp. TaxID=1955812 RepID=UPI0035699D8E